jgi:hypothetical protein
MISSSFLEVLFGGVVNLFNLEVLILFLILDGIVFFWKGILKGEIL